jgi:flagellar hook assembly protein FlgD
VDPGAHAGIAALRPVMPNPVARQAAFSFELYRSGHATFSVYDVTGRRVARLIDATLPAGVHAVTWDGRDDSGLRLSSGVYLYELSTGGARWSRRMILVH